MRPRVLCPAPSPGSGPAARSDSPFGEGLAYRNFRRPRRKQHARARALPIGNGMDTAQDDTRVGKLSRKSARGGVYLVSRAMPARFHLPRIMNPNRSCPDCGAFTRRDFLKTTASAAAASALGSVPIIGRAASEQAKSETLVATLFKSLNDQQRKPLCFQFDHPLRSAMANN